jgi:hypothetical protein
MGKKKNRETGNFLPETVKVHPIHLPGTLHIETQWKDMYSLSGFYIALLSHDRKPSIHCLPVQAGHIRTEVPGYRMHIP